MSNTVAVAGQGVPAVPSSYFLLRCVTRLDVVANGYQVTALLPVQQINFSPDADGEYAKQPFLRMWAPTRFVYASYEEVEGFLRTYFTCAGEELDAMADRAYRIDLED